VLDEELAARPLRQHGSLPGRYVIEYVRLGELAEFFVPHEVDVRPGDVTCLGTFEVVVQDLAKDLGNNSSGELNIVDDCADIRSNVGGASAPAGEVAKSLARPAPRAESLSLLDVPLLRAERICPRRPRPRAAFVLPLGNPTCSWRPGDERRRRSSTNDGQRPHAQAVAKTARRARSVRDTTRGSEGQCTEVSGRHRAAVGGRWAGCRCASARSCSASGPHGLLRIWRSRPRCHDLRPSGCWGAC
jgi:hypothetical protein